MMIHMDNDERRKAAAIVQIMGLLPRFDWRFLSALGLRLAEELAKREQEGPQLQVLSK